MSDRKALARATAARTSPRFIDIKNEEWRPLATNRDAAKRKPRGLFRREAFGGRQAEEGAGREAADN